jgi:hypothetical protein
MPTRHKPQIPANDLAVIVILITIFLATILFGY